MKVRFTAILIVVLACIRVAAAQSSSPADELTGALKKIRDSSVVTIGFRQDAMPFSYLNPRGKPIGYSIELGRSIVEEISNELGGQALTIKFVPVTAETRIDAVLTGTIDLECGVTTSNVERRKRVAFSPVTFVAGTKLMVQRGSAIKSFKDLKSRTVAVTAGTTNEKAMHELSDTFDLGIKFVACPSHDDSYAQVASGKVDAFATDDSLLYALIAKNKSQSKLTIVGDFLTYDPYGIMFRKDDAMLAAVVDRTFHQLAESRDLEYTYKRWFTHKLPGGEDLNLPMSPQLAEIFRSLGAPDED
ncbi:MAG TPA: amino acid ABC transporter substrate-binding protein [Chthoniobacterales bacterium]